MIAISFKFIDQTKQLQNAVDKATFRNVAHAAASIRSTAIESIKDEPGPSEPGTPPHTHKGTGTVKTGKRAGQKRRGILQRAIAYSADKSTAVVGTMASFVGESGEAHEFGGDFKGDEYPERPFIGPALESNLPRFAESFGYSIGE